MQVLPLYDWHDYDGRLRLKGVGKMSIAWKHDGDCLEYSTKHRVSIADTW